MARHVGGLSVVLALSIGVSWPLSAQTPQTQLWDAAMVGDTVRLGTALRDGARLDSLDTRQSENGRYALNWAALNNRVDALRFLLARGAALEARNFTGFTALHHAAEMGSLDAAKVLLEAGADPTHRNDAGLKPADTARERGHIQVVALLDAAEKEKGRRP